MGLWGYGFMGLWVYQLGSDFHRAPGPHSLWLKAAGGSFPTLPTIYYLVHPPAFWRRGGSLSPDFRPTKMLALLASLALCLLQGTAGALSLETRGLRSLVAPVVPFTLLSVVGSLVK